MQGKFDKTRPLFSIIDALFFFPCIGSNNRMTPNESTRSYEDTQQYRQARQRIPQYEQYLARKLFSPHDPYVLLRNKYPYTENHFLFWINPTYERFYSSFTRIKSIVYTHFPARTILHLFENTMENRSVLKIRHVHVILDK